MPHDRKGNLIAVGDKVFVPATVTSVQAGDNYCNCSLVLDEKMPPDNTETAFQALNTRQVQKYDGTTVPPPADDNPPPKK